MACKSGSSKKMAGGRKKPTVVPKAGYKSGNKLACGGKLKK